MGSSFNPRLRKMAMRAASAAGRGRARRRRSGERSCKRAPGDTLDIAYPALFDIASKKEIEIDHALFPNAFSLSPPVWWKDSRGFTFEYNQRGHQAYTVIEVNAETGKARALIAEQTQTFF